jgi:hypothetical protein
MHLQQFHKGLSLHLTLVGEVLDDEVESQNAREDGGYSELSVVEGTQMKHTVFNDLTQFFEQLLWL